MCIIYSSDSWITDWGWIVIQAHLLPKYIASRTLGYSFILMRHGQTLLPTYQILKTMLLYGRLAHPKKEAY